MEINYKALPKSQLIEGIKTKNELIEAMEKYPITAAILAYEDKWRALKRRILIWLLKQN